jgi:hypothetical protein
MLPGKIMAWLEGGTFGPVIRYLEQLQVWEGALGLLLLLVTWKVLWPKLLDWLKESNPGASRMAVFAVKWARTGIWNLLWLLRGTPIVLALGVSGVAWVDYLFDTLPFLAKTRIQKEGR